jgi:ABC-type glutathione transport system ATPase component
MAVGMPLWMHPGECGARASIRSGGLFRVVEPMHKLASAVTEPRISAASCPLVVDVRDVSLTFETADGEVEALSRVNLQVAEGEFLSFIGPSGCGKTTLLRLIADLEQPTFGALRFRAAVRRSAKTLQVLRDQFELDAAAEKAYKDALHGIPEQKVSDPWAKMR